MQKPKFNRELPQNYASDYETRYILRLPPNIVDDPVMKHGMITVIPAYLLGRYGPLGAMGEYPWTWARLSDCGEFFQEDTTFSPNCDEALKKHNEELIGKIHTLESRIQKALLSLTTGT